MDDSTLQRFFDEVIASAAFVETAESAAAAEAWASGAIADWEQLTGATVSIEQIAELPIADGARHLLELLSDPAVPVDPRRLEAFDWSDDVDRHDIVDLVTLTTAGGESAVIMTVESPSGARHDLSITTLDDIVIGVTIGPEGLAQAATEDASGAITVEPHHGDADLLLPTWTSIRLDDDSAANGPLLRRRFGATTTVAESAARSAVMPPERDPDDDRWAAELVRRALPPCDAAVLRRLDSETERRFSNGDVDLVTLAEIAGLQSPDRVPSLTAALAGAYLAPRTLQPHPEVEARAIIELELADWIGALLGLARANVGTDIDGRRLVEMINRCPEITTGIPKADQDRIAWAFECTLYAFVATGILDADGATTPFASVIIDGAVAAAWGQY